MSAQAFAPMANAALVTSWNYAVTLEWTAVTFAGTGGSTFNDSTLISWRAGGVGNDPVAGATAAQSRSGVEITDTPALGMVFTNGGFAPANAITHFNNAISASFAPLDSAQLSTTFTLTPLTPAAGPNLGPFATSFTVQFTETRNTAPCGFGSTTVCDDIFVITLGDLDFTFDFGGITYDVNILETTNSLAALSAGACARAGAPFPCVGFQTPEGQATPASFAFTISAAVLPEPGILALLGLGLVGLGLAQRKGR